MSPQVRRQMELHRGSSGFSWQKTLNCPHLQFLSFFIIAFIISSSEVDDAAVFIDKKLGGEMSLKKKRNGGHVLLLAFHKTIKGFIPARNLKNWTDCAGQMTNSDPWCSLHSGQWASQTEVSLFFLPNPRNPGWPTAPSSFPDQTATCSRPALNLHR